MSAPFSRRCVANEWRSVWQVARFPIPAHDTARRIARRLLELWHHGLCGLWLLHTGEIQPRSARQRVFNVAVGLPTLVILFVLTLLEGPFGSIVSFASRLAMPSILGIVIPRWTARFR